MGKYGHLHVGVKVIDMKGRTTRNRGVGIHPDKNLTLKCKVNMHVFPPPSPPRELALRCRHSSYIGFKWELPATWGGCALSSYECEVREKNIHGEYGERTRTSNPLEAALRPDPHAMRTRLLSHRRVEARFPHRRAQARGRRAAQHPLVRGAGARVQRGRGLTLRVERGAVRGDRAGGESPRHDPGAPPPSPRRPDCRPRRASVASAAIA